MRSREFRKQYHPSLGRYVYVHRGNGLIVDNLMKPLKGFLGKPMFSKTNERFSQ